LSAHRTQHLRQWAWAQLGPSAGAGGERRQPDLIACEHSLAMVLTLAVGDTAAFGEKGLAFR
jgi:hypothetical protein